VFFSMNSRPAEPEAVIRTGPVRIDDRRYLLDFIIVTSLFFSWAFAAALNDILIRQFQKALDLTRVQSSFIQLAKRAGLLHADAPVPATRRNPTASLA
jgi:MFS transporter, FHS family, L-fucose permease